jgi:predicted ATPase
MLFLHRITLLREEVPDFNTYPFTVPAIRGMDALDLESEVTFFVGENGSGKSTLLEAIAYNCGFNTAGGGRNNIYDVDSSHAALGNYIRLSWLPKISQGFFLRAESFYHFASHIDQLARKIRLLIIKDMEAGHYTTSLTENPFYHYL